MSQQYAVFYDGQATPHTIGPLETATRVARNLAKQSGKRINVFKLIQTHTYKVHVCRECGELPVQQDFVIQVE